MENLRKGLCVVCFALIWSVGFGQTTASGCLLPNNRVYTNMGALGTYFNNASVGLSLNYCSWTPKTGPACSVCNSGLNLFGACLSTTTQGIQGNFTMVACDLDKSSPLFMVFVGIIGIGFLKKRASIKAKR